MFGSFPPSLWLLGASKVYSGLGADIVYGREAIVSRNRLKVRASIIGTVENVQPLPDSKTGAATSTSKLVEMGTASPEGAPGAATGQQTVCSGISFVEKTRDTL